MIDCQKCGQTNADNSKFCRFCGEEFVYVPQPQKSENFENSPPGPYSWKSGEYPVNNKSPRTTRQIGGEFPSDFHQGDQQLVAQEVGMAPHGYRCPFCKTTALPIVKNKVSTPGWIVFTILLVTTFFLFWIGLLIREDIRVCPVCKMRVG